MRTLKVIASVMIVGLVAFGACGGDDGDSCDDAFPVAGNWTGTLADANCGNGTLTATFAQQGCQLTGVWTSTFSIPACNAVGDLRGDSRETTVEFTLEPNGNGCRLDLKGVPGGANQMSGAYLPHDQCQVQSGGAWSMTRATAATVTPGTSSTPTPVP